MATSNYEKQLIAARAHFLKWDQAIMSERFCLENDANYIYIRFFGMKYSIDRTTAQVFRCHDSSPAGFEEVMSIYDVLCDIKYDAYLSGEWQTLKNLSPHSNFGASGVSLYSQAEKRLSGKVSLLDEACARLGGQKTTTADVGYQFDIFDFLPIIFQFWDGDDEFPPRISFLFDKNSLDYIRFETAWYIAGYLLELIEKQMDPSASGSWFTL